jgi:hypothetical protein
MGVLPFLPPAGARPPAEALDLVFLLQIPQDATHHVSADSGACSLQIRNSEFARKGTYGVPDAVGLCADSEKTANPGIATEFSPGGAG